MRLEALGVAGAPAPGRLTTTFRLPGGALVDTGAAAHGIDPAGQTDVAEILLTHAHLDHTLGLPFLLGVAPLRVLGLPETLAAVQESLLDGRIWPDLSTEATWVEIGVGDVVKIGSCEVEIGPAAHSIPCVSIAVRAGGRTAAIIGDTRLDGGVLAWAAGCRPDACIVEASFPDALAGLAQRFGHQTASDLRPWRQALGDECDLYVTHVKPAHDGVVRAECEALGDPGLRMLQDNDVIEV